MLAVMMAIWRVCPHFIEVTALLNSRQIGPFEQPPLPLPPSLHLNITINLIILIISMMIMCNVIMVIVRIMTV